MSGRTTSAKPYPSWAKRNVPKTRKTIVFRVWGRSQRFLYNLPQSEAIRRCEHCACSERNEFTSYFSCVLTPAQRIHQQLVPFGFAWTVINKNNCWFTIIPNSRPEFRRKWPVVNGIRVSVSPQCLQFVSNDDDVPSCQWSSSTMANYVCFLGSFRSLKTGH